MGALARGEQGFAYKEFKGTPPRNGRSAISRVLSIAVKGNNVYVELKSGPGKLTATGAITPNGKATVEVNVGFKLHQARRMAASVLAYLHAWDVMRMMIHQQVVSRPAPYTVVSATSEAHDLKVTPVNGATKSNGTAVPPVVVVDNGRPVTRKGPAPQTNGAAPKQPLQYGNGAPVDSQNQMEVQTFQRYVDENKAKPESKAILLDYYQQRVLSTSAYTQ